MVTKAPELFEATDEMIEDAVLHADPMVLRGLLYQLTGDEGLAQMKVHSVRAGLLEMKMVTESADVALIRSRAASLLRSYRDSGPDDVPIGPDVRLHRSLELPRLARRSRGPSCRCGWNSWPSTRSPVGWCGRMSRHPSDLPGSQ